MMTQARMYYNAVRKSGELNAAFFELVNNKYNPMTSDDLEALIKRRPSVYGRFAGFIEVLRKQEKQNDI